MYLVDSDGRQRFVVIMVHDGARDRPYTMVELYIG